MSFYLLLFTYLLISKQLRPVQMLSSQLSCIYLPLLVVRLLSPAIAILLSYIYNHALSSVLDGPKQSEEDIFVFTDLTKEPSKVLRNLMNYSFLRQTLFTLVLGQASNYIAKNLPRWVKPFLLPIKNKIIYNLKTLSPLICLYIYIYIDYMAESSGGWKNCVYLEQDGERGSGYRGAKKGEAKCAKLDLSLSL